MTHSHATSTQSGPISGKPGWKAFGKVILRFLQAGLGFGFAWGFWWLSHWDLWFFKVYGLICVVGSLIPLGKGLWMLIQFLLQRRKWARYEAQGVKPKADPMAGTQQLRDQGLLK